MSFTNCTQSTQATNTSNLSKKFFSWKKRFTFENSSAWILSVCFQLEFLYNSCLPESKRKNIIYTVRIKDNKKRIRFTFVGRELQGLKLSSSINLYRTSTCLQLNKTQTIRVWNDTELSQIKDNIVGLFLLYIYCIIYVCFLPFVSLLFRKRPWLQQVLNLPPSPYWGS